MVAHDCARAYRTNSILTASPGQLVLMLYDGALGALAAARIAFGRPARDLQRFEVINKQLTKARAIVTELQGRLDYTADPEFAQTMFRLYEYYGRRLMEANLRKDAEPVAEVEKLLGEIRDAWAAMLMKQRAPEAEPALAS
ncbi:MAG TPA: flagellar export chaperone FliS [Opitutaceae bacterium]|jgi:flagellar protein FliS|nr:flagellar export chaperone FliS [Opitutaceae bacterium]